MDIAKIPCRNCRISIRLDVQFCPYCGARQKIAPVKPALSSDPTVGTVLDNRYRILERIGKGGMAVVYRAQDVTNYETVAIKMLRPPPNDVRRMIDRFRREATLASRLSHPNTVQIHGFGRSADSTFYLVMDFIHGVNLKSTLKKRRALTWAGACHIASQVAKSLKDAHDNNIIHRDLKPDNIMLAGAPEDEHSVKVLDFGIAKIIAEDEEGMSITAPNELFGTPDYMSPEQIGGKDLDHRTDIYSLGVLLYRMLTGDSPFVASTSMALMKCHLHRQPRPFREANSKLRSFPWSLEPLVMSMLHKNPERRPPDMRTVFRHLDQLLTDSMLGEPPCQALSSLSGIGGPDLWMANTTCQVDPSSDTLITLLSFDVSTTTDTAF